MTRHQFIKFSLGAACAAFLGRFVAPAKGDVKPDVYDMGNDRLHQFPTQIHTSGYMQVVDADGSGGAFSFNDEQIRPYIEYHKRLADAQIEAIEKQAQEGIAAIRAQHAEQVWSNQAQLKADIKPLRDVIARLEARPKT